MFKSYLKTFFASYPKTDWIIASLSYLIMATYTLHWTRYFLTYQAVSYLWVEKVLKKAMNSIQQVRGTFSKWYWFINGKPCIVTPGYIQVCLRKGLLVIGLQAKYFLQQKRQHFTWNLLRVLTQIRVPGTGTTDFCRMLYSKISKFSFWYQSFMVQLDSKLLHTYSQTNVFTYVYLKSSLSSPLSSAHPRPIQLPT